MLFKRYHIYPMFTGLKTETRRTWKRPHARIGHWYDVTHKMYYQPEEVIGQIYVNGVTREPLSALTHVGACNEGGYDVPTYFKILNEINKDVIPRDTMVYVIKFRFILSDIIDPNGGTIMIDEYRQEWIDHMKKHGIMVNP
jgi:hypothetical protein